MNQIKYPTSFIRMIVKLHIVDGVSQHELSKRYGISQPYICRLFKGIQRKEETTDLRKVERTKPNGGVRKLMTSQVREIRLSTSSGAELAIRYNVSRTAIRRIRAGISYKEI